MTTAPIHGFVDTWNDAGVTFSAIKVSVTDTASAAGSKLIDFEVGGVSQASVTKGGEVICKGLTSSLNIDLQGNRLVMDADNDTYLEASTDDRLDIVVGGALVARFDANTTDTFQLDGVGFSPTGAVVGQALGYPNSATKLEPYTPAGGGDLHDIRIATNYGVTGDGVTDDTAAIQALLDECGQNGWVAFFPTPSVRYLLSDEIRLNYDNTTIIGSGRERALFYQSAEGNGNVTRAGFFAYQTGGHYVGRIGFTRPSGTQPNLTGTPTDAPWTARPTSERSIMLAFMESSNNVVDDVYFYRQINGVWFYGAEIITSAGQAFTTTTTTFKLAADASAIDDDPEYIGASIRFLDEAGDPFRQITAYDGTTKVATFTPALSSAPTATGDYTLYRNALDRNNVARNIYSEETDFAVLAQRQRNLSIKSVFDKNRSRTQGIDPHAVYLTQIPYLRGEGATIRDVFSENGPEGSPVSAGGHNGLAISHIYSDGDRFALEFDNCDGFSVGQIVGKNMGGSSTDGRTAGIRMLSVKNGVLNNFSLETSSDYSPTTPDAADRPIGVWVQNDANSTALASLEDYEKTRNVLIKDGVIVLADPNAVVASNGVSITCEKNVKVKDVKVITRNATGGAAFLIEAGDNVKIENPEIVEEGSGSFEYWLRALTTNVTNSSVFWDASEFPAPSISEVQDTTSGGFTRIDRFDSTVSVSSFTPVITGTSTAGVNSYSLQTGSVDTFGVFKTVYLDVRLDGTAGALDSTGNLNITGCPVTPARVTLMEIVDYAGTSFSTVGGASFEAILLTDGTVRLIYREDTDMSPGANRVTNAQVTDSFEVKLEARFVRD